MNKDAVFFTKNSLANAQREIRNALDNARLVKDPELTKKLEEIRDKTEEAKVYIVEKTDPKTFG